MKPLRWRYCSHCGFGGGLGKVKSIKRVCKNMRCVKFGKTLEIGSMKDADLDPKVLETDPGSGQQLGASVSPRSRRRDRAKYMAEWRAKKKAEGICLECPRPAARTVRCEFHEKQKAGRSKTTLRAPQEGREMCPLRGHPSTSQDAGMFAMLGEPGDRPVSAPPGSGSRLANHGRRMLSNRSP